MAEEVEKFNPIAILNDLQLVDDSEVDKYEKSLAEEKEKERLSIIEENYKKKSSGVPSRYLNESLETYKPTPENVQPYKWILGFTNAVINKKNTKNIVYISGKFGTGKTHLGCGMVRKLGGKIITSLELCITYDSCRDFKSDSTRIYFLKHLCDDNDVLVIDEIGKGIASIEKEIMPYIVNEFYGSGKILVFLGNESKEDFNKTIGEAGTDRMSEVGVYLSLIGESCRGGNK
jgi:DNA replication protein DnaC